ncbi:uncharacterized protein LOC107370035 [Tetranychus urticae]|uniref:F-box domain-containing protein n=1 Tax=Tetranychus urticae TaxID=32264 RepID=T1L3U3_TETUR|nr:uncharacterized protein LOC107370035 [Tetranychus urticae]
MSLDLLPDSCLINIFSCVNSIHDISRCLRVCSRWNRLMRKLMPKVKYLIRENCDFQGSRVARFMDIVFYCRPRDLVKLRIMDILPNLKIIDMTGVRRNRLSKHEIETLKKTQSLKGLIYRIGLFDFNVAKFCPNLRYLSTEYLSPADTFALSKIGLTQLFVGDCFMSSLFSPTLVRLHISDCNFGTYNGPDLKNLKILEISAFIWSKDTPYNGFSLINRCPALESVFMKITGNFTFSQGDIVTNFNIRDFILESFDCEWDLIKKILVRYPNIKHLAIRENVKIDDSCVFEIIDLLPNLVLLDLRESPQLTKQSAAYIRRYNRIHNTCIKFYYKNDVQIICDWKTLSYRPRRIVQGIDFMKHCFLQTFEQLPHFMNSKDD